MKTLETPLISKLSAELRRAETRVLVLKSTLRRARRETMMRLRFVPPAKLDTLMDVARGR